MGKIVKSKNKGLFQVGHKPWNKGLKGNSNDHTADSNTIHVTQGHWQPRLGYEEYSKVVKMSRDGLLTVPDADGNFSSAHILRPMARATSENTVTLRATSKVRFVSECVTCFAILLTLITMHYVSFASQGGSGHPSP